MTEELTLSRLQSVGVVKPKEPQLFYSYALLDAVDEPFATFRFDCQSHGTLMWR